LLQDIPKAITSAPQLLFNFVTFTSPQFACKPF